MKRGEKMKFLKAILPLIMFVLCLQPMPISATSVDDYIISNGYELSPYVVNIEQSNLNQYAISDNYLDETNRGQSLELSGDSNSILLVKDGQVVNVLDLRSLTHRNGYYLFSLSDFNNSKISEGYYNLYLKNGNVVYKLYNEYSSKNGATYINPKYNLNSSGEVLPLGQKEESLKDTSSFNISIQQDEETNNIVIQASNTEYLKNIKKIALYDGSKPIFIEIQSNKENKSFNSVVNGNTLTIFYSKLLNMSRGVYRVTCYSSGFEITEINGFGLSYEKGILSVPNDVKVNQVSNNIIIQSKDYNFINGLLISYSQSNKKYTYSSLKISSNSDFSNAYTYENTENDNPYTSISVKSDGSYSVSILTKQLELMGIKPNEKYYIKIQSASFEEKTFGPLVLIEEKIQTPQQNNQTNEDKNTNVNEEVNSNEETNTKEDINQNTEENVKDEPIHDNSQEIVDNENKEDNLNKENSFYKWVILSLPLLGILGYFGYNKYKKK